jgi:hypothetical protein
MVSFYIGRRTQRRFGVRCRVSNAAMTVIDGGAIANITTGNKPEGLALAVGSHDAIDGLRYMIAVSKLCQYWLYT